MTHLATTTARDSAAADHAAAPAATSNILPGPGPLPGIARLASHMLLAATLLLPLALTLHQDARSATRYVMVFRPGLSASETARQASRPGWRIIRLICVTPFPAVLVGAQGAAGTPIPRTPPGALAVPMPGLGCFRPVRPASTLTEARRI